MYDKTYANIFKRLIGLEIIKLQYLIFESITES
jgi:hypothetical protein